MDFRLLIRAVNLNLNFNLHILDNSISKHETEP